MKMRLWLLLAGFIILYYFTHAVHDWPYLLRYNLYWVPHAPILIHITALVACFACALFSYLLLFYLYPAGRIKTVIILGVVGLVVLYFITFKVSIIIITSPIPIRRRLNFS